MLLMLANSDASMSYTFNFGIWKIRHSANDRNLSDCNFIYICNMQLRALIVS